MKSLYSVFFEGFLGGFAAFLMPCIYPMLPLTVSFFSKQTGSRASAIRSALIYGLSIVVIYVLFGAVITAVLGPAALNNLASSGIFNLAVFVLLVLFAISFFGVFEITLPSGLINRADSASGAKTLSGIFFMAFTLSLVSFSCTAGIIGWLLVEAVRYKSYMALVTGMTGFSLALALPFTLAAIFPKLLGSLPKSGAWLNSVKVVLGFIELALSLKFLSSFDLVYHTGILSRDTFLALWIVIFSLMGLYLLGKIRFAHDAPLEYVSVTRLLLAMFSFAFSIYIVPGLWGAPLKALSGFTPPLEYQEFVLPTGIEQARQAGNPAPGAVPGSLPANRKYASLLHEPPGFSGFFDINEARAYARQNRKPLLIDFTGHSCVNCRKMEASVWTDPRVKDKINNEFVLVSLYVDERTALPVNEQYTSAVFGTRVNTVGSLNADIEASRYNTNSQPFYVIAGDDLKALVKPSQYNSDINQYLAFLNAGISAFKLSKK